jgi:hypothetical protein
MPALSTAPQVIHCRLLIAWACARVRRRSRSGSAVYGDRRCTPASQSAARWHCCDRRHRPPPMTARLSNPRLASHPGMDAAAIEGPPGGCPDALRHRDVQARRLAQNVASAAPWADDGPLSSEMSNLSPLFPPVSSPCCPETHPCPEVRVPGACRTSMSPPRCHRGMMAIPSAGLAPAPRIRWRRRAHKKELRQAPELDSSSYSLN